MSIQSAVNTKHYSLNIHQKTKEVYIAMQMLCPLITTTELPHTYDVLEKLLPSIYSSMCFNNGKLPFSKEVKNTEIGHLFEHILLEYLFELKQTDDSSNVVIKGETNWNWLNDPKGLFHIRVNAGEPEANIFPNALSKTVSLLNQIIEYSPTKKQTA